MSINRFESSAQADFINYYVPIPFEAMMAAGASKQQRYDQTLASANTQASAIGQIQATPGSKDETTLAEINRNLEDVISKYSTGNIDLSNSVIQANFDREIKQAAPREVLNKIAGTYAGYSNYKKAEAQAKSRGQQIYKPFDFTNYDSLGDQGVFDELPTMDLGAQAEAAIKEFMTKPQQDWREITLDSGRTAIEYYRDVNKISNLIQSEKGELTNRPDIRQLMERMGVNTEGFKTFLESRKEQYVDKRLGAISAMPESTGSYGVSSRFRHITAPASTEYGEVKAKDFVKTLNSNMGALQMAQANLDNLEKEDSEATDIQIEIAKSTLSQLQNKVNRDQDIINDFETEFGNKYKKDLEKLNNELLELGTKKGLGNNLEEILIRIEKGSDPLLVSPKYGTKTFIPERVLNIRDKMMNLENKIDKEKDKALSEYLSKSVSHDVILPPQISESQGIYYVGAPGNKLESAFVGQIQNNITDNIGNYEFKVMSGDFKGDDKIEETIKERGLKWTSAGFKPNADGSVDVHFKVDGVNKKGKIDKSSIIKVKISNPTQVRAIANDFRKAGDTITANRLLNSKLAREIKRNEWSSDADYTIKTRDNKEFKIHVEYNTGTNQYDIYNDQGEVSLSVDHTVELEAALYNLQDTALEFTIDQLKEFLSTN